MIYVVCRLYLSFYACCLRLPRRSILEYKNFVWIDAGLINHDSSLDFLEIAFLACFCAIHNHGFDMLFSFSAIVQHTPSHPVGFSILKAGLNKSVLLSVYASSTTNYSRDNPSYGIISPIFLFDCPALSDNCTRNSALVPVSLNICKIHD